MYHRMWKCLAAMAIIATNVPRVAASPAPTQAGNSRKCRYLPGDCEWPKDDEWQTLNATVGGRLISGKPLAQSCYGPARDATTCGIIREQWVVDELYCDDPVNVMFPYWLNNSCNPFTTRDGTCILGNLASYAINVSGADDVLTGIKFARDKNIRLIIKNTGHDVIGRSTGKGSLALWTHHLKNISVFNYTSGHYIGPAIRMGAGVQITELNKAASHNGLRAIGGYCPTVGVAGGYTQNGGYGALSASYGLAADNTLEFEVITTDGRHIIASPDQNSDLFWALSGGGSGNYAVVISLTTKAHVDGPVAGATFIVANTNADAYWKAVHAWNEHLLVLDKIPGFSSVAVIISIAFRLNIASLPGGTKKSMAAALDPFFRKLQSLNLTIESNTITEKATYFEHYNTYVPETPGAFPPNNTVGGRLVPRLTVQAHSQAIVDVFREIIEDDTVPFQAITLASSNVSPAQIATETGMRAVLPAWRSSLYTMNFGIAFSNNASVQEMESYQVKVNAWQDKFKPLTDGAYINEATFDNPDWKLDYFGENYDKLLDVKQKYDPDFVLWQHTSVGSDAYWEMTEGERLCGGR
ncbi:FAD binding domain-containing protein [Trichoderma aethiopicum]